MKIGDTVKHKKGMIKCIIKHIIPSPMGLLQYECETENKYSTIVDYASEFISQECDCGGYITYNSMHEAYHTHYCMCKRKEK